MSRATGRKSVEEKKKLFAIPIRTTFIELFLLKTYAFVPIETYKILSK